jgi:hypothetical protein
MAASSDAFTSIAPFKPAPALKHIHQLPFDSFAKTGGRYFEDGDTGNVYSCWVDSSSQVRFAVIRRDAFPLVEEKGALTALNVPAAAGLVEAIHVRLFPNNIVGFDFNFFGPRLPRFGQYLNTVANGHGDEVVFEPLLRQDVVDELQGGKELRLFRLRIRESEIDTVENIDKGLGRAFREIRALTSGHELEVLVRPKPYSGHSIGTHLMKTAKRLAKRPNVRDVASEFRVKIGDPGRAGQDVDLLGDHFIADARILKQDASGRALDSADAFANVKYAYDTRSSDLKKAASLAGS